MKMCSYQKGVIVSQNLVNAVSLIKTQKNLAKI